MDGLPVFTPLKSLPSLPALPDYPLPEPDPHRPEAEKACRNGDVASVKHHVQLYLQESPYPESLQQCLTLAVEFQSKDIVQYLLDLNVPITAPTITAAVKANDTSSLALFLKHNWDINANEAPDRPPWLALAIATNPDSKIVSWFLQNGADPNAASYIDTTPLSSAIESSTVAIVQQLFDHCSELKEFRGQPLHFAARRADEQAVSMVELVLSRCNSELNKTMWADQPFPYACWKLTGLGTPLHEAARQGTPKVAEILLRAGVDRSRKDSDGKTALDRARLSQNQPMVDLLAGLDRIGRAAL